MRARWLLPKRQAQENERASKRTSYANLALSFWIFPWILRSFRACCYGTTSQAVVRRHMPTYFVCAQYTCTRSRVSLHKWHNVYIILESMNKPITNLFFSDKMHASVPRCCCSLWITFHSLFVSTLVLFSFSFHLWKLFGGKHSK